MYLLYGIVGMAIGFIIGTLMAYLKTKEKFTKAKNISVKVIEKNTGIEHYADKYKISLDDNTPYVRFYGIKGFEWQPIWNFKNPYLLMLVIDPEYAKENILSLFSAGMNKKLTKAAKK